MGLLDMIGDLLNIASYDPEEEQAREDREKDEEIAAQGAWDPEAREPYNPDGD